MAEVYKQGNSAYGVLPRKGTGNSSEEGRERIRMPIHITKTEHYPENRWRPKEVKYLQITLTQDE